MEVTFHFHFTGYKGNLTEVLFPVVVPLLCICNLYSILLPIHSLPCAPKNSLVPWFLGCCCSVARSCLTLCCTMDRSKPGFPVLRYLPEFVHTRTYWVGDAIPLSSVVPFSSCHLSFPASGSFQMSRLFTSSVQSIGTSASASVLPMNIQGWFPLKLTGLISLLSKGLCRVFSSTTVPKHQFFGTQPSLWSNSHNHTWLLERP